MLVIESLIWLVVTLVFLGQTMALVPGEQKGLENPLMIPFAWACFQYFDFMYLYFDPSPHIRNFNITFGPYDPDIAVFTFFVCINAILVGLNFSLRAPQARRPLRLVTTSERNGAMIAAMILVPLSYVVFFRSVGGGDDFDLATVSALKAQTSTDLPFLAIIVWMATVSFGMFLLTNRLSVRTVLILAGLEMVGTVLTGSRTHMIIVGIFLLQYLKRRGFSISALALPVIGVPVLALLTVIRSFRAVEVGNVGDFINAKGGVFSSIFGSDEVGMAEIMTYGVGNLNASYMQRFPGEGVSGLLVYFLPRSIFAWKPFPASSQFTQWVSPDIWASSRSQFTIGVPMEATMEFGVLGAVLFLFMVGYFAGRVLKHVAQTSEYSWFYYGIFSVIMLLFLRTDMQSIGIIVWPLIFTLIFHKLVSGALRMARGKTEARLARTV